MTRLREPSSFFRQVARHDKRIVRRSLALALGAMLAALLLTMLPADAAAQRPQGWDGFAKTVKRSRFKHYTGYAAGTLSVKFTSGKETDTTTDAMIYSDLSAGDTAAAMKLCKQVAGVAKRTTGLTIALTIRGMGPRGLAAGNGTALATMTVEYLCQGA